MGYQVGSESWYWLKSKGAQKRTEDQKAPKGIRHAVAEGKALCGYGGDLHIYGAWEGRGFSRPSDRCPECVEKVAGEPSPINP